MRPQQATHSLFTRVAAYSAPPLILISLLLVLVATLYPYTVNIDRAEILGTLGAVLTNFLLRSSGYDDMTDNVLLFIPLGFSADRRGPGRVGRVLANHRAGDARRCGRLAGRRRRPCP